MREIEVLRFRRCSRDLLPFYYASRGRDSSYFGFSSHFWVKNGGTCKGTIWAKKFPKLDFLRLGEGNLRLDEGLCLGEGKLRLDKGLR